MADIAITPTNVVKAATTRTTSGVAGVAVTAGQWVYLDAATGKYGLADTDSATVAARTPIGMALHAAAPNQPLTIATAGPVTLGAVLTAAVGYYLSGTAGAMCPVADVAAGDYPVFLGFATSSSVLNIDIVAAGVVLA